MGGVRSQPGNSDDEGEVRVSTVVGPTGGSVVRRYDRRIWVLW